MKRTITNAEALNLFEGLRHVSASNGLVSLKLARTRKLLVEIAEPAVKAFDEIGQRCAQRDEAGAPIVVKKGDEAQAWLATGTPFYSIIDADTFNTERHELMADTHEIDTVTLSDSNLTHIAIETEDKRGQALAESALAWLAE